MFGKEPVFIFDPNNNSNTAVDMADDPTGETGGNALVYWKLYPEIVRNTFTKAFTVGLRDPDARVTPLEWQETLVAMRDSLFRCGCGTPNFYDLQAMKASGGRPGKCWSCSAEPRLPFRIRLGNSIVMLNADSKLYPHHMADGRAYDYSQPVAEVVRHPTDPNAWGLKNLSGDKWVATLADGTLRDVEPGRSARLVTNTKINFGRVEGEIRY